LRAVRAVYFGELFVVRPDERHDDVNAALFDDHGEELTGLSRDPVSVDFAPRQLSLDELACLQNTGFLTALPRAARVSRLPDGARQRPRAPRGPRRREKYQAQRTEDV
jgi:hypothetical protein